jgi:hypothetical protein
MPMLPVNHHPSECEPHEVPATTIQQPSEPTPFCWPTSTMPTRGMLGSPIYRCAISGQDYLLLKLENYYTFAD